MLAKFSVNNFKNFEGLIELDLEKTKNFEFNGEAIRNNVINTALIYGENGSGKSNLGLAIMDISSSLTDKEKNQKYMSVPMVNLNYSGAGVDFKYKFKFDSYYVEYEYTKSNPSTLLTEKMIINDKEVLNYNHTEQMGTLCLEGAGSLNTNLKEKNIAFAKYVHTNSVLDDTIINKLFLRFFDFVNNMLLFSSLENNHYQGFSVGSDKIDNGIVESGQLKNLQNFLKAAGLEYDLIPKEVGTEKKIYCKFGDKEVNLFTIASRGTCTLILFFYWLIKLDEVSFVFIDEFDAFYHNELARYVVQEVLDIGTQAILTTHNTSIMDNDLLRPDCYFNINKSTIQSFSFRVNKDLRKAHNIEKMYRAGSFDG